MFIFIRNLFDASKTVRFIDDVNFTTCSKLFPKKNVSCYKDKGANFIEAEVNSVDALFPGKKFDLILCDIEGAVIDALKGMPETLRTRVVWASSSCPTICAMCRKPASRISWKTSGILKTFTART